MQIIKPKQLSLTDHPQFVQTGFYKYVLGCTLVLISTLAASITMKSLPILIYGGIISIAIIGITIHLYYMLTRDNVLVLDAICIDITNSNIPLTKRVGAQKLLLKSNDVINDRTYSIVNRASYNCNIGDKVIIYTTSKALFLDSNEYVVINTPLFIKVSKSR